MAKPASRQPIVFGRLALIVTVASWLGCVITVVGAQLLSDDPFSLVNDLETIAFVMIVSLLAASASAYIITRQGYLRRTRSHLRVPRAEIDACFDDRSPSTTVLVPSYRERPEVIRKTIVSAALQELPDLRVVLLVDDPPDVTDEESQHLLEAARAIPAEIDALLEAPRTRVTASYDRVLAACRHGAEPDGSDLSTLADDYEYAASWVAELAASWEVEDHADDFFVNHVLGALSRDLGIVAAAIRGAESQGSTIDSRRLVQLARRLVWIFTVDVASFERKRYAALAHDPNKAMNLNAYIGLMGSDYREQATTTGTLLAPCESDHPEATVRVPATDYILTLDADSVLLPEYGLRLVYLMEQPEQSRVAVVQTPYSAYPGAPTRVERLAGATTDIQYIVHQGMAQYGAAFWVGANAVLRAKAVAELRVDDESDGHTVSRFISDRTVIEDTESTLDLTTLGWEVVNYPERLAYSASPPDFGSLCIQRQRWANGGLIILSKLRAYTKARREAGERISKVELLLRLNYLGSIAWTTVGVLLLLAYPFSAGPLSGLVLLMSAPYFVVMATDLKRCGYKRTDVVRIYGFNLVILPVNASGVLKSVSQLLTDQKLAFARTPKVKNRTVAPALFVIFPYLIVLLSLYVLRNDIQAQRWAHAAFAAANALIVAPAIVAIIGIRHSITDVWRGFVRMLYAKPRAPKARDEVTQLDPTTDWSTVLYYGSVEQPRPEVTVPNSVPSVAPRVPEKVDVA